MGFGWGLALGYALGGISGITVFAWIFGTRAEGVAQADVAHQRRQNEAIVEDQERADDIERKADLARRAPAGDQPLADRLHASGRGRKTGG